MSIADKYPRAWEHDPSEEESEDNWPDRHCSFVVGWIHISLPNSFVGPCAAFVGEKQHAAFVGQKRPRSAGFAAALLVTRFKRMHGGLTRKFGCCGADFRGGSAGQARSMGLGTPAPGRLSTRQAGRLRMASPGKSWWWNRLHVREDLGLCGCRFRFRGEMRRQKRNPEDGILKTEENAGAAEQAHRASLPQPTYLFVSIREIRVESYLPRRENANAPPGSAARIPPAASRRDSERNAVGRMMGMREFVAERLRVPSGGQRGEAEITPRRVEPRRYESATGAPRSTGARNCRKCGGRMMGRLKTES